MDRVNIEQMPDCTYEGARFAWGTANDEQELLCTADNELTRRQKSWRNTGSNKIVWDFYTDEYFTKWGAEAQIICRDPSGVNECIEGGHDCDEGAECIKTEGQSGYICQCPSAGIKWGDQTVTPTGAGTTRDPCKYTHPDFPSIEIFPIAWDGQTLGVVYEQSKLLSWEAAFERCNELGMTLPLPSNDAENTALTNFLIGIKPGNGYGNFTGIFLGAHNSNAERKWVNLYTDEEITYNQWSVNQPDNAGNAEKVAEMWTDNGDWNDITLTNSDDRGLICIMADYDDWEPDSMDLGEFLCETGLNQCHASATSIDYTGNSTYIDYQCACSDVTVGDIDLTPMSDFVSIRSACGYTLPDLGSNVEVNIFTYDGKPTVYHNIAGKSYAESVKYCAGLGMHLPVPNTEQQYQDLKTIPRYFGYNTYWLGYTDSATEGTWLNIYNGEELAIDKWGSGEPNDAGSGEDQIEMYQYGAFQWYDINPNC